MSAPTDGRAPVRRFRDVAVGDVLPVLERTPTRLTLFLFGVAYWTSHRIHYDVELARSEGFDDVLVTANLMSAYSAIAVSEWAGDPSCLLRLTERNVSPAVAGDTLRVRGEVVDLGPDADGGGLVHCGLNIEKRDGTAIVRGRAILSLPA